MNEIALFPPTCYNLSLMTLFFLMLQVSLFFWMALHDWVDIPPFTDLKALKKAHSFKFRLFSSLLNAFLVLIPLGITFYYFSSTLPLWARLLNISIYGLLTLGTITAWWIPYFGYGYWIQGNEASFEEYRYTHSFLPARGTRVVPNTLHVLLHLQVWLCFILSFL